MSPNRIDWKVSVACALQELIEGEDVALRYTQGEMTGGFAKCRTATLDIDGSLIIEMPTGELVVARFAKGKRS